MPKHQLLRQVKAKSLSVKIPKNEPNTARLSWVLANEEFLTVEIPRRAASHAIMLSRRLGTMGIMRKNSACGFPGSRIRAGEDPRANSSCQLSLATSPLALCCAQTVEVTSNQATVHVCELRLPLRAVRHGMGAARVKVAAGRRPQRAWHLAGQDDFFPPLVGTARERSREEGLGIGMLRCADERLSLAALDDLAQVHDDDRVTHMRNGCEIVGDEQVGQA